MNIKTKKAYPLYNCFEREKDYIKSKRLSFIMLLFVFAVLIIFNINFIVQEIVEVTKAEFLQENIENTEYIKINNQEKRRLLADYSEFIIYNGYKEEKKEEVVKKEVKKEEVKKVEKIKPVKQFKKVEKKEVKKANPQKKSENVNVEKKSTKATAGSQINQIKDMKNEAASNIVYMMERYKKYPKQARRLSAEGITNITFSIEKNGVVTGAEITKSSGYSVLDNAALKAAQKIVGLNAVNNSNYNEYLKVTVPVDFYLK